MQSQRFSQRFSLVQGDITKKLLQVSLPIIGTQLMLMGYNLVDMFLLGRVGSDAVAASGTAGLYMWLSGGVMLVGRMGAEIGVAQNKGRRDNEAALSFSRNALFLAALLGVLYGLLCLLFPAQLIGFIKVREAHVVADAIDYLWIVGLAMPFVFISSSVAGSFTGSGNSRAPFIVNACGLVMNALLDPLFIFTLDMGVQGAAWATVISQAAACLGAVYWLFRKVDRPFAHYDLFRRPSAVHIRQILRWSIPMCLESMLFTFFLMVITRFTAGFGAAALTVFRVGGQLETLCWLVCQGFSTGITAFVGQNYGAGHWQRMRAGIRKALTLLVGWGLFVTVLFIVARRPLVAVFVPVPEVVDMGASYVFIMAFCQVFSCFEAVGSGVFRALGRTIPPSVASITSNGLRIPLAYALSRTSLGTDGIWLAITLGAMLRGSWIFLWFLAYSRKWPSGQDAAE